MERTDYFFCLGLDRHFLVDNWLYAFEIILFLYLPIFVFKLYAADHFEWNLLLDLVSQLSCLHSYFCIIQANSFKKLFLRLL